MQYSEQELSRLHEILYEILSEIHRICTEHNIPYFLIGGSAIGLYYDGGILPWDDDLDIGMTRENYNRFLEVAPKYMGEDYFLSCVDTDLHTPFFYAKVKKKSTLFIEERYKDVDMHHGIFVDVFPYDRIPDNRILREVQYRVANFIKCCMMGKEVWMWKHFGKCQIEEPLPRSIVSCLINKILNKCFSKKRLYDFNVFVQTLFNKCNTENYNLVVAKINYVPAIDIKEVIEVNYGPVSAQVLKNWKANLHLNYPTLRRHSKEEQCNHAPLRLSFNE